MGSQKFFSAFGHRIDAQETIDWHTKFHNSSKTLKLAFLPHAKPCALVEKPTRCDVLTSLFRIPRKRVQAATSELEKELKLQLKQKCRKLPPQGEPDRHFQ